MTLVERISTTPPNPAAIRPATGSLAEALQNVPENPDFDLETWTRQWAAIEAEIKAKNGLGPGASTMTRSESE